MNRPRCTDTEYIDFLVATPRAVSYVEAARVHPRRADAPAHDAFTRLLHRLEPDPAALWAEVSPLVDCSRGVLIVDDSTLDKPCAEKIALVHRHWSGKHHAVVDGINLITLLWTDGDRLIPIDDRIDDKTQRRDHQERAFPRHAAHGAGARLHPGMHPLRSLVRQYRRVPFWAACG